MFQLGKTIVSEEIIKKDFVCNLSACKGACCVDGEAGAPLEKDEVNILEEIYPKVKTFLRKKGRDVIEKQGTSIKNDWGELETPLIDGADCAYVIFDEKNTAHHQLLTHQKSFYKKSALIFAANNFTAIANKTTPNTFRIICIPVGPIIRSILDDVFNTI